MAISFIGGGNWRTRRKPQTCHKSHWQTLSHNVVHLAMIEIRTHNISDCICSCKSNYHPIMATIQASYFFYRFCSFKIHLKATRLYRSKSYYFIATLYTPKKKYINIRRCTFNWLKTMGKVTDYLYISRIVITWINIHSYTI